jgi:flagella basal body P-ring formation protein FlgA
MFKLILIFVCAFAFVNATHAEPKWQTHESIYEAVKAYVAQNINTTAEYEINIVPLASRLNLALCEQPIDVFTPNMVKAGRVAINVRCNSGKKWAIFVPIIITPFENIIVLTQNMQYGDKITEHHVALARKNVTQLHNNYMTDLTQVINKQISHNLSAGTVMTTKDIDNPTVYVKEWRDAAAVIKQIQSMDKGSFSALGFDGADEIGGAK